MPRHGKGPSPELGSGASCPRSTPHRRCVPPTAPATARNRRTVQRTPQSCDRFPPGFPRTGRTASRTASGTGRLMLPLKDRRQIFQPATLTVAACSREEASGMIFSCLYAHGHIRLHQAVRRYSSTIGAAWVVPRPVRVVDAIDKVNPCDGLDHLAYLGVVDGPAERPAGTVGFPCSGSKSARELCKRTASADSRW